MGVMAHKKRPFTRRQRARMMKAKRILLKQETRADKQEAREFFKTLTIFRGISHDSTERLANDRT